MTIAAGKRAPDEGIAMRYVVRQRMFSIGDDFWITDEDGDRAFLVDGKAMRLRETFELKNRDGDAVATVRKKMIAFRDTMEIERDGSVIATVKKAVFSPLHHKSVIELADGGELEAAGDIIGHEFEIKSGHRTLARVSRSWFSLRDTYGVDVARGADAALLLAVAVCLDRIQHDEATER